MIYLYQGYHFPALFLLTAKPESPYITARTKGRLQRGAGLATLGWDGNIASTIEVCPLRPGTLSGRDGQPSARH